MRITYKNKVFEAVAGDIGDQPDIEAVVNAANAELKSGGGVAGAIHRTAGPELYEECKQYAPINSGEAVITQAYNLPNDFVIHCLGPVFGKDKPEEKLLANCYRNALLLADAKQISSIAFPAISTGAFGFPVKAATQIAFQTIILELKNLKWIKLIKFVLYGEEDLKLYNEYLKRLSQGFTFNN